MLCVADCIIRRVTPQATEWENLGNWIDTSFILARTDFVNGVNCLNSWFRH